MQQFNWTSLYSWVTPTRGIIVGVVLIALTLVLIPLIAARILHVDERELPITGLPDELDGTKVAFVADVHAGPFFTRGRVRNLAEKVNEYEPDVIILGGDYVGGRAHGAEVFYPEIQEFEAAHAKVAVLGNHDVWEGEQEARDGLAAANFELLENSNVRIEIDGATLALAGVNDLYTGSPDTALAAQGIAEGDTAILVSHNPDVFAEGLPETGEIWNLALAGHTHGGQVSMFGKAAIVPSQFGARYRSGWMEEEGVPILVSNGVGTVTLPLRVQTPAEIHIITLRKA